MDSIASRFFIVATAVMAVMLAHCGVAVAAWQSIGSGNEKVDIDRSRIGRGGDGQLTIWSRANLPRPVEANEGRYNSVEALNRYDCTSSRYATIKRLYLFDNMLVRVETVLVPRAVSANPGGVDAAIIDDICTTNTQKSQLAAARTDIPKTTDAVVPGIIPVSDSAAPKPNAAAAPPRFITLPRIDPSLLQHPTDEIKPKEVAKRANDVAAAVRTEAAKAGVALTPKKMPDRHAQELAMATTGPRPKARRILVEDPIVRQEPHRDIHWGYEGEGSPGKWAKLRSDYSLCEIGQRQSPIDIHEGIHVDLEPIKFDYRNSMFRIIDNGHTVQVNMGEGNSISVMGRTYRLVQLHFHRPSEERIDGRSFEMVMHLVHKDDEGRLAVVAVLLDRGAEHAVIQTFWNNLPLETNLELSPAVAIDVNKLLPETRNYYTYMGSLTTPPCSEGVLWMVLKQPLQVSPEQIAIFSRLYPNNARPIQASNGRLIKDSR